VKNELVAAKLLNFKSPSYRKHTRLSKIGSSRLLMLLLGYPLSYFPQGGKDAEVSNFTMPIQRVLLPPWGKVGKGVKKRLCDLRGQWILDSKKRAASTKLRRPLKNYFINTELLTRCQLSNLFLWDKRSRFLFNHDLLAKSK
jgi:hypothetical protein